MGQWKPRQAYHRATQAETRECHLQQLPNKRPAKIQLVLAVLGGNFSSTWSKTPEVIALLLDRGANAGAQKDDGQTAFDIVEENEHLRNTEAYELLQ